MTTYQPLVINGRAYPVVWDSAVRAIRVDVGGLIGKVYGQNLGELSLRVERLIQIEQERAGGQ